MAKYSKLIAGIAGNLLAILIAYLAVQWPAVAQCAPPPGALADTLDQVCTVLGFSQTQITAGLMVLVNAIFIERSPANAP